MKKLLLIMLSLLLCFGLVACDNDSTTYTFKARVVEKQGSSIIVEPLEGEDIRNSSDRISVGIGDIPELNPPVFPEGTLVEIEYDGTVAETYPARVNVISLRTIDE